MATISITNILANYSAVDDIAYTTASFAPSAKLLLFAVVSRTSSGLPNTPTITGNSLTWQLVDSSPYDTVGSSRTVFLFRARGDSATTGSITIDWGGQTQTACAWTLDEITSADPSGSNGSVAIVQANNYEVASGTSNSITLSAFSNANNATYGVFSVDTLPNTATAGSGFSIYGNTTDSENSFRLVSEFKNSNDTTVDMTFSATSAIGGVAVEIKAAPDLPTVTTSTATGITSSQATGAGNVTADGGGTIIERGFCYAKTTNPTIADLHVAVAGTTGSFTGDMINLDYSTQYHYRAFATNTGGTSYGADTTFTTLTPGYYSIFINGIDRTNYILLGSVSINDEIYSKINTCTFKTYDEDNSFKPDTGDNIAVFDQEGTKIFAGVVSKVSERMNGFTPDSSLTLLTRQCDCQDYTKLLQRKLIIETYENKTCKVILQEMLSKYFAFDSITTINCDDGPTIGQIAFNYITGEKAIDSLAKAAGYTWYLDYDKDIHFFFKDDLASVKTFDESSDDWVNLVITPDTTQLRNRVYVRGGIYYSDPYTQIIKADGTQEEFFLAYTPSSDNFHVSIGASAKSVGIANVDENNAYDFMLNRKEKVIKMGGTAWAVANTPPASGTLLTVVYNYEIPVLITQENTDSITAIKNLDGGDGIYEYVIADENITSISAARERAQAELRDYSNTIVVGSFDSYNAPEVKSGDVITLTSARRGLNTNYLVNSVKLTLITPSIIKYSIQFSGRLYGLVDILIALFKQSTRIILGKDEVLDAFNSKTDFLDGIQTGTPTIVQSAPPFHWSNDAGTTTNKARWNLSQWS